MGGIENSLAGLLEPSVRYHSCNVRFLTLYHYLVKEQFQAGSLTGAVTSQRVMEVYKGSLRLDGNQPESVKAKASLTARLTCQAETKVGFSDPTVLSGKAVAQRIKVTLGITG